MAGARRDLFFFPPFVPWREREGDSNMRSVGRRKGELQKKTWA